jgi:hypothetical protein
VKKSRTDLTTQLFDMKIDNELKPEKKSWAEVKALGGNRTR